MFFLTSGVATDKSQPNNSELRLLIHPKPKATITAFVAGPVISSRTIHLPLGILDMFLRKYRQKIGKAARQTMRMYPSGDRSQGLCLCLTESYTETWKLLHVRGDTEKPPPLAMEWNISSDDLAGRWAVLEVPGSGTTISGGVASYKV